MTYRNGLLVEPAEATGPMVLVSGSFPDQLNRNLVLRRYLVEGFVDCLGPALVRDVSLEILPGSILHYEPDLVLCLGSSQPGVVNYHPVRAACDKTGAHLAFWLHEDPYEFDLSYSATDVADTILSNDSWSVLHYTHPRVFHLPMAASPRAHFREWKPVKDLDVFFCGVGYPNRVALLRDLAQVLKRLRTTVLGAGWPADLKFAENRRISNAQLTSHCADSWITLSLGRDFNLANDRYLLDHATPGPRTFEAAMSGTVQLCFADSLEILDYFPAGAGLLLFDGPEDFRACVKEVMDDPVAAKQIAAAGQARALEAHTYAHRAASILKLCGFSSLRPSSVSQRLVT